jgi:hypothetical protein
MNNKITSLRRSVIVLILSPLIGLWMIFAICACGRQTKDAGTQLEVGVEVEVASINVTPANLSLEVGQTQQISAMIGDAAGNMLNGRTSASSLVVGSTNEKQTTIADKMGRSGRLVTLSSSHPDIVKITDRGLITGLAEGAATITATCENQTESATVIVTEPRTEPLKVVPASASISVGETLQLTAMVQDVRGKSPTEQITWDSNQPSRAMVDQNGLVRATQVGAVTITANSEGYSGAAILEITPATTVWGLDFPGSAGVNTTMRFEFTSPPSAYPATYIWRAYPRQQRSYYTTLFWANNGTFFPSNTYYGFHPYPDWNTTHQHFWEIATPPGGDFISPMHVIYDRWYIQVAVCSESGGKTVHEFYWDWPDTTKVIRHTGERYADPPSPGLVVGDAPWNSGQEVWDGILRGFQFYDAALTISEIKQEIESPGSARRPWYLNLNPTPMDISDKSESGNHPTWVGAEKPSQWTGRLLGENIIRTVVSPR